MKPEGSATCISCLLLTQCREKPALVKTSAYPRQMGLAPAICARESGWVQRMPETHVRGESHG